LKKSKDTDKKTKIKQWSKRGLSLIEEGKTEIVYEATADEDLVEQKPIVFIGSNEGLIVPGKDEWINLTSGYLFRCLNAEKKPTYFVSMNDKNSLWTRKAIKLNMTIAVRKKPDEAFLKRHPSATGYIFKNPLAEFIYGGTMKRKKDSTTYRHPVMYWDTEACCFNLYDPHNKPSAHTYLGDLPVDEPSIPHREEEVVAIRNFAIDIFKTLRRRFMRMKIELVAATLTLGYVTIHDRRVLAVCGMLGPDSMLLMENGQEINTQFTKENMEEAIAAHKRVMEITRGF